MSNFFEPDNEMIGCLGIQNYGNWYGLSLIVEVKKKGRSHEMGVTKRIVLYGGMFRIEFPTKDHSSTLE